MTLDQIYVFHEIVRSGSFKSAALVLNKTQPAVSFSMKKLEDELGVSLFDRTQYRPELTEFGQSFLNKSLLVLEKMKDLDDLKLSFLNHEEPELKIAIDGISPLSELLKVFKSFSEKFVHTKISLDFDVLFEVENKVISQDFSLGITHFIQNKSALDIFPLGEVKMAPVMNAQLFDEKKIETLKQLREIDQIVLGEKVEKKGVGFGLLEDGKKWRVTDNNFKREIILAGLGWGHLPYHTIEREVNEGRVVILSLGEVSIKTLDIYLIRSKNRIHGRVAQQLWSQLTTLHRK